MSGTDTVAKTYFDAAKTCGIIPYKRGTLNGFFPSCSDISMREEALLAWMRPREFGPFAGTPYLQVFRGECIDLEREINAARYDKVNGQRMKLESDLLDCLEYAAAWNPGYIRIPDGDDAPSARAVAKYKAFLKEAEEYGLSGGVEYPGIALGR
ncbi:hypothetical protein D6833_05980 [Candidatus Parcubacteria bacterium]|nr:MAG: hypothetical protein D6833_05980 [Candidatus Parcubacteria bacterium]